MASNKPASNVKPAKTILNRNPWGVFAIEAFMGWIGFLGVGWFITRRPAMAMALFVLWLTTFWVSLWGLLELMAPGWFPFAIGLYIVLPIISGIFAATSFASQVKQLKRELELIATGEVSNDQNNKVVTLAK